MEEAIGQMEVRQRLNLTQGVTSRYFIKAMDPMLSCVCIRKDKEQGCYQSRAVQVYVSVKTVLEKCEVRPDFKSCILKEKKKFTLQNPLQ